MEVDAGLRVDAGWELVVEVDGAVRVLTARTGDSPCTAVGSHLGQTWAVRRMADEWVGGMVGFAEGARFGGEEGKGMQDDLKREERRGFGGKEGKGL